MAGAAPFLPNCFSKRWMDHKHLDAHAQWAMTYDRSARLHKGEARWSSLRTLSMHLDEQDDG
jgi:hypothetical protein